MSKAEKFIQNYKRNCSNELVHGLYYHDWLTPDQARKAVEIEREEIIEKACDWLRKNIDCCIWIEDFRKAITNE